MDLDDHDNLEMAVQFPQPLTDSLGAEHKERSKGDDDRRKHGDVCRNSRVSDEAAYCRRERHKHNSCNKRTRVAADGADSFERDWDGSGRCLKKASGRPSREGERWEQDNRERKRRDKDWNTRDWNWEKMGGRRLGGRGEGRHFGKQVDMKDGFSDGHNKFGGYRFFEEKKGKKEAVASTEQEIDPERGLRTVFAHQISLKADERDVFEFFSNAGKVRDVRLIMDQKLRRSKGMGYVEFYDATSVPMAIAMTGQLLLGQPVMVKPSEVEKNLIQSADGANGATEPYSGSARRLYVGNLQYDITDAQLKQVFEPFGSLEFVQLSIDPETGQSKGYAFIQFAKPEDAHCAQTSLNGALKLGGRFIKVLAVTEPMNMQERGSGTGELDDNEDGGVSLTPWSRTQLMQKLDRSGTVTSITGRKAASLPVSLGHLRGAPILAGSSPTLILGSTLAQPGMTQWSGLSNTGSAASIGAPSECLLLENMFDPSTETDADFEIDIKDEVQSECSKFGTVKHIYVDKDHGYLAKECINALTTFWGCWTWLSSCFF